VQGYNAQQIGQTIMWSGLPQVFMMPVAALLLKRIDARLLLAAGLALFSGSSFLNSALTNLTAHDQLRFAQCIRALGMPLVIVPLTTLTTCHVASKHAGSASALFNMFRNLGGSVGIALLATQVDLREKMHSCRLGEAVTAFSSATGERLAAVTQHFVAQGADAATAGQQALAVLAGTVRRESYVAAYSDCFYLLGVGLLVTIALVWFCKPAKRGFLAAH